MRKPSVPSQCSFPKCWTPQMNWIGNSIIVSKWRRVIYPIQTHYNFPPCWWIINYEENILGYVINGNLSCLSFPWKFSMSKEFVHGPQDGGISQLFPCVFCSSWLPEVEFWVMFSDSFDLRWQCQLYLLFSITLVFRKQSFKIALIIILLEV